MKKCIILCCALLLFLPSFAFADGDWRCPECGGRVPAFLGNVCPNCGFDILSVTPTPSPTPTPKRTPKPAATRKPTPEPTPTPSTNTSSLQKGDRGDEVQKLQNRLFALGFLLDEHDGDFDNKTQTAVKLFQQVAGLEVTGIADAATQEALYADDAPTTQYAQVSLTPTSSPSPEGADALYVKGCAAAESGDFSAAAGYYQLAADQGNCEAAIRLGNMYAIGEGVKRSDEMAAYYYTLAETVDRVGSSMQVWCPKIGKYYHAEEHCSGMGDAILMSYAEACREGKVRCPSCWPLQVWCTENGMYYHAEEHCSGMHGAIQMTYTEACREGKARCPRCWSK